MKGFARCLVFLVGLSGLSTKTTRATLTCDCTCEEHHANSGASLTDAQMRQYVKHVEMEPDRMGNHSNLKGIAVFRIAFDRHGRVSCAEALSGHPIAISLLTASMERWRFKRFVQNGSAVRACGRLTLRFSVVEGQSAVEVITGESLK